MTRKPKVLLVGESSFLSSGYSTFNREVLKRLHARGDLSVTEFGSFGQYDDERAIDLPWNFVSNMPNPSDPEQVRRYESSILNKFGAWKLGDVLLDVEPDVVFSCRDFWNDEYIFRHPLRDFFHLAHQPTVDAAPQMEQWVATYMEADSIFTYTDWGMGVLREQSGGRIKGVCATPPGADIDVFQPVAHRATFQQGMGLPVGSLVVGFCARNQRRKLIPDLCAAFAKFLSVAPDAIRNSTYLYLHTAFPDEGWDIPKLIRDHGIGHRTLFTYACRTCGEAYPSPFADALACCRACGNLTAVMPDSSRGVNRETLAKVYNLMDVFVQYSLCLKPGTPIYTAAGWKPIEAVTVGESVLTHTGNWKPVVRTFHQHDKTARSIKVWGSPDELVITDEHPVLAITSKQYAPGARSIREIVGNRLLTGQQLKEPEFVPASELVPGDLLAFRIDDRVQETPFIDLAKYAEEDSLVTDEAVQLKRGREYPRYIRVSRDLCRFLGLYAAEGCVQRYGGRVSSQICLTTHARESHLRDWARRAFPQFADRPYSNRNAVTTSMNSRLHAKWLDAECGKSENKKLPDWTLYLPHDFQFYLLYGLFAGDGCYVKSAKVCVYTTTSHILRTQVEHLLRRCRIAYNLRRVVKGGNRKPQYRFEVPGDIGGGSIITKRNSSGGLYYNQWHLKKVKTVLAASYCGDVHNLEVQDDNSYLTNLTIVHNCEGMGMPQVEAAACGVPVMAVDYSAMSDVVRKVGGFPVRVQRFYQESGTDRMLALPDNDDLVRQLIAFLSKPESLRKRDGYRARRGVLAHYTYDRTAKLLGDHFASVSLRSRSDTWGSPSRALRPNCEAPQGLSNEDWVRWCFAHVLNRPDKADSYAARRLTRDLNWGETTGGMGGQVWNDASALGFETHGNKTRFGREQALEQLVATANEFNYWEQRRCDRTK